MFRGVNTLNLDAKGRMAMPSKYREKLTEQCSGQLVVTLDLNDPCLLLYPLPAWEEIERQLVRLPNINPQTRKLQRLLIGHASECEFDNSGRILLPPLLRERVNLEKRVTLIGQGKKFEIWDEQVWNEQRDSWLTETDSETLSADLENISL